MILSKAKLILSAAAIVSLMAASFAVYKWGYQAGKASEADRQARAVLAYQQRVTKLLRDLETEQNKRQEVLIETREVIRHVQDPTGCNADTTLGNELNRLCAEGNSNAC